MKMKKLKSHARRVLSGPSRSDPQHERDEAAKFWGRLHYKSAAVPREVGLDEQTTAKVLGVAGEGARALLIAESFLQTPPKGSSEEALEAFDRIETSILIAQALFKGIACAALSGVPSDYAMKPADETAFNQIVEDDDKHSLAITKTSGIW
jgi:hypothetical protein